MKRPFILCLLISIACFWAPGLLAASSESTTQHSVIKVELPQDPHKDSILLTIVDRLAWPILAAVALIALREPLIGLLGKMATPGTEFTVGGLAVKLPAVETKLAEQQKQIDLQSGQINRLITLSMSWYIYRMLYELDKAKKAQDLHIFRNDGSMDRNSDS